jgi:hypothetical protein
MLFIRHVRRSCVRSFEEGPMKKLRVRIAWIAIVFALAATQCGGGDDGPAGSAPPPPAGATGSVHLVLRAVR